MLPTKEQIASDPARQALRDRIEELGLSMAEVSVQLGKNRAYLQQFLTRGSPATLSDHIRNALAIILRMNPAKLLHSWELDPDGNAGTGTPRPAALFRIPVYSEKIPFRHSETSEWIDPPAPFSATPSFACWVREPAGKFNRGDLVFCHSSQPIQPGDYVVSTNRFSAQFAGIGQFVRETEKYIVVELVNGRVRMPAHANEMHKIVAAYFA